MTSQKAVPFQEASAATPSGAAPGFGNIALPISFAGLAIILDGSGAAYLADHRTLLVSDLHLEKGSSAGAAGRLIPALDSHDTLLRLRERIEFYRPKRMICLGDSFHDRFAGERMAKDDRNALNSLCALADEWIWISGNHDPSMPPFCEGETLDEFQIEGVTFRHEPNERGSAPQIAGHFHPKISVPAGGRRFSGRCFCVFGDLLIMPAFGAYTGGLSCSNPAIRTLRDSQPQIFMLHASKLWRVA